MTCSTAVSDAILQTLSGMSTSSGNPKTYGKRFGAKRKHVTEVSDSEVQRSLPTSSPIKRCRVLDADAATDVEEPTPKAYGSPAKDDLLKPSKGQGPKPAQDLSGIFDSISPSGTPPTKLAKRMLGRSRTESSAESHPSPRERHMDRTSSLPNLSSSPSMSAEPTVSPSRQSGGLLSTPSKQATTRTYADRYRSFLVAIPTSLSQGPGNSDDFEARESYSSLRSRWGVDNLEDDPSPYDLSPTKSASTVSETSPSRHGKGKGKALVRTTPLPPGMMNPLRSISELRNKGESRRFLDEVGYVFEGLDSKCGIGLRRARFSFLSFARPFNFS